MIQNYNQVRRGRNQFRTSYPTKRAAAAGWRPFFALAAFALLYRFRLGSDPTPQLPDGEREGNDPEGLRFVPRTHDGNERGAQSAGVDVGSEHDGDGRRARAERPDCVQ